MSNKDDVRGTSIGYAINLTMDYGNGRQATISGTLPLEATLKDFNRELDKLRFATNRQAAFVIMRNREAQLAADRKVLAATEHMLKEHDAAMEKEIENIAKAPESQHSAGKLKTQIAAQLDNMRTQAVNFRMTQQGEISKLKANIGVHETIIASVKAEIEHIEKQEG